MNRGIDDNMSGRPNPNRDALIDALQDLGGLVHYDTVDKILSRLYDAGWDLVRNWKFDGVFPSAGRLVRDEDETGISGTGPVAWVVEFPDGVAVTRWAVTDVRQTCVWASIDDVVAIHGHNGKTRIEWA
jgi:hypothetical protein